VLPCTRRCCGFRLLDREHRSFGVERRWYRGKDGDWLLIGASGPVDDVANQVVPLRRRE
jgi:hypothetical protein